MVFYRDSQNLKLRCCIVDADSDSVLCALEDGLILRYPPP